MFRKPFVFWFGWYGLTVVAAVIALAMYRDWALQALSAPAEQAHWRQWQESVEAMQSDRADYPVQRRVPPSEEPPGLRLMRDYFWTCVAGVIATWTILFAMIAIAVSSLSVDRSRRERGRC